MKYNITQEDIHTESGCPLCKSQEYDELADLDLIRTNTTILKTVHCSECGFVYRAKRPTMDWFLRSWSLREDEVDSDDLRSRKAAGEERRLYRYAHLERVLSHAIGQSAEKTILDLGCGTGSGLTVFRDEGWKVVGLEPDHDRSRIGREEHGLDIRPIRMEDFNASEKFNIVSLVQVLEHLADPVDALKRAASFVQPGGYLYVEVPNFIYFVDCSDAHYLEHFSNFSYQTLCYAGSLAGLKVSQMFTIWTHPDGSPQMAILFEKGDHNSMDELPPSFNIPLWDNHPAPVVVDKWKHWQPIASLKHGPEQTSITVPTGAKASEQTLGEARFVYGQLLKPRPWDPSYQPHSLSGLDPNFKVRWGVLDITCPAHTLKGHPEFRGNRIRGLNSYFIFKAPEKGSTPNNFEVTKL